LLEISGFSLVCGDCANKALEKWFCVPSIFEKPWKNEIFLKKTKSFLKIYLVDFIQVILRVRKDLALFRKKTAKGVDDPL
jgi:hypothetical protein